MREENIRPETITYESKRLEIEDARQLLKHSDKFKKVSCPACGSYNYRTVFNKNYFTFVLCTKCETIFINPRPTFKMLEKHYETSKSIKHWNDKMFPASEDARRDQIFKPRARKIVEICKKHKVATKILLDVGAGFGTFCEEIKNLSVFDKVIAIEPSHALAKTCRHKGLDVIEKSIENIKDVDIRGASVITNFELIEHLYCPKDFLLSCSKVLPKGGTLILTTPNIRGFDLLTLGKLSDNIEGPGHLNYFHSDSLSYLLGRCGFEVIEILTPGKLDAEIVRKKALEKKLDLSGNNFLKTILINQWDKVGAPFQQFLSNNMLSSHMWVVARRMK